MQQLRLAGSGKGNAARTRAPGGVDVRLLRCTTQFESAARASGFSRIAGLDEVGRGCLFGPLYAAAVILSPERPIRGLRDSKLLPAVEREKLAAQIQVRAEAWAVASVEANEVDLFNVYQASRLAMKKCVEQISPSPDYLLVDALTLDVPVEQRALIHGDARCRSIAAASILAKVTRDRRMAEWHEIYPNYGFCRNKGYATPEHREALRLYGPTAEHRTSFITVRLFGSQLALFEEEEDAFSGMPLAGPENVVSLPEDRVPGTPRRARLVGLLLAILCFEMGIFLIAFPWSSYWSSNFFAWLTPGWRSVWINPYFRGAISGLGLINLYLALLEVFRLQARAREAAG